MTAACSIVGNDRWPAVVREAKKCNADGVICGHIHTPEMSMIDGVHYCNDGDWVESCSALVEHHDGRFELIRWATAMSPKTSRTAPRNWTAYPR